MSKRLVMVSVILCLGLFFGTLTSAVGTQSSGQDLDKLMEMLVNQGSTIKQYDVDAKTLEQSSVKQLAGAEMTAGQKSFALAIASKKRENKIAQEKYSLQRDYYSLYQLVSAKEIAELEVDVAAMNLNAEVEKLSRGLTTEASVTSMKIAKKQKELSLEDALFNVEKAEIALKGKLGLDMDSELAVEYSIPTSVKVAADYKLQDFINKFKANNIDLATLENDIKLQKEYIEKLKAVYSVTDTEMVAAVNDLNKLEEQKKALDRDYTIYAKGIYHNYNKSAALLQLQYEYKPTLDNKVVLLDKEYVQKKYSTLEYNQKKVGIKQEYRSFDAAVIDYLSNKALIDLVMAGNRI